MNTELTNHWVADIFPLNQSDIDRLAEDIKANGQLHPIITYKGQIIDGRTRLAACKKVGVEPAFDEYEPEDGDATDEELLSLSWSFNETRRHLSTSQRACAAAEVIERRQPKQGGSQKGSTRKNAVWSRTLEQWTVSETAVRQARELLRDAPATFALVKAGELTVGAAYTTLEKTRALEREESQRNSLARIREQNADLAEQVELGKLSITDAQSKLEAQEAERHQRKLELAKITTGIFVALSGLALAKEAMIGQRATAKDIVGARLPGQQKEDVRRYAEAISFILDLQQENK